jgi:hypothetical protein
MAETDFDPRRRIVRRRQIGAIGTTARVVLGLFLLLFGVVGGKVSVIHGQVRFGFEPLAVLLYGASMLLAAVRGYGGCEVLAVSNWVLRRNDQVGCLVLAPVDHLERRWRR